MTKTTLGATTLAVVAAASAGGAANRSGSMQWYRRLRKPSYVPPKYVFPIAWTLLYADIAASAAAAIDHTRATPQPGMTRSHIAALATNLVLNAGWSWLFFRHHRLGASAVSAALLTASSADLVRRFGASRRPGRVLVPYPLWCAFATAMSTHIWQLNRS